MNAFVRSSRPAWCSGKSTSTEVGGDRYFFCNEQNEKGESVTWQSRQYQAYPIQGSGFEMNGKGQCCPSDTDGF